MFDLAILATALIAAAIALTLWPRSWIGFVIFLPVAAFPAGVPRSLNFVGALVALILGAVYCLFAFKPRRVTDASAAAIIGVTALFAAWGLAGSHPLDNVILECRGLIFLAIAIFIFGRVAGTDLIGAALKGLAVTLWFSFTCVLLATFAGLRLAGRALDASLLLSEGANLTGVVRLLTPATHLASATVAVCVALWVLKPGLFRRTVPYVLPAFGLVIFAFSRNSVVIVVVAALVAPLLNRSYRAFVRSCASLLIGFAMYYVTGWILAFVGDVGPFSQLRVIYNAYGGRVVEGLVGSGANSDRSLGYRDIEIDYLLKAIPGNELIGHGFGYSYKPVRERLQFGTAFYSHNYYLWTIVKTGFLGMTAYATALIAPLMPALRGKTDVYRSACAATAVGCLIVSWAVPFPVGIESAVVLGALLGCASALNTSGDPEASSLLAGAGEQRGSVDHGQPASN